MIFECENKLPYCLYNMIFFFNKYLWLRVDKSSLERHNKIQVKVISGKEWNWIFFLRRLNIYISLFFSLGHALWYAESSSLTRDQSTGAQSLNHWTTSKVPGYLYFYGYLNVHILHMIFSVGIVLYLSLRTLCILAILA